MKKTTLILITLFSFGAISAQTKVQTPDQVYGELFKDVQMSKIFPDGKTFVDCVPKRDPKDIVKDYLAIKKNPAIKFSLELFVKENFELPPAPPTINYIQQEKDVVMHIKNLWGALRREPDKKIRRKFITSFAISLYSSRWPLQGNLLLGFLFHYAWIKRKW